MRVVMLEAPKDLLDERRRLGLDGRDEMWDGMMHVVPPAGGPHQRLGTALLLAVAPLAQARGLVPSYETGLFAGDDDYRVPDLLFSRPEHLSDRGVEAAEMIVEMRSSYDESYAKFDFYAARGVREMLVLHPKGRRVELFRVVDGRAVLVSTDASGAVSSEVLGLRLATVEGRLRLTWAGGASDI